MDKNSTRIGDLFIHVESLRQTTNNFSEYLVATLTMVNTNSTTPVFVYLHYESGGSDRLLYTLTDSQGTVFTTPRGKEPFGIGIGSGMAIPHFTEIGASSFIKVTIPHVAPATTVPRNWSFGPSNSPRVKNGGKPPYRLQFSLGVATDERAGRKDIVKKYGVLIEIEGDK